VIINTICGTMPSFLSELTPQQRQIYQYARACVAKRGYGPSVREIAHRLRLRSLVGVRRQLRRLQRQGYIQCVQFTAHAVQLVPAAEADSTAVAIVPRGPSVRQVDGQVLLDLGLDHLALGRDEALRLARQLWRHAGAADRR
jgi:repressor LexA